MELHHESLHLLPTDAVNDLAEINNHLGGIYGAAGDFDRAVQHFRASLHYEEKRGNLYGAAQTRFNMAITLSRADRRTDALEYAGAALRGFESYGARAAADIEKTRGLIAKICGG